MKYLCRIQAGPLALALVLGLMTAAAAIENRHIPWWGCLIAGLFWPLFSIIGQMIGP